jgi:hypothetical protein
MLHTPQDIIGSIRRFGVMGVPYQVLSLLDDDPQSVLIRVLETEEETAYPLALVMDDPRED